MPQFELGHYSGQLFWLAVCFIILNVVMIGWLLPRLQQSIALREKRIRTYQQEAQTLLAETATLNNEIDKQLSSAQHQALALIQQRLQDIEAAHKESLAYYGHKLEQKFMSYETTLVKQVQVAHQELQTTAASFAEQLSGKYFAKKDQGITR
jgi:F-type H+-transporting ATPase subunit b